MANETYTEDHCIAGPTLLPPFFFPCMLGELESKPLMASLSPLISATIKVYKLLEMLEK